ncbi:MAG: CgeB family protein, partial [Planctomycetota bacterium]
MKIQYINPDPPSTYRYYTDLENELRKMVECDSDYPDVIVYGLSWLSKYRMFSAISQVPLIGFVHKIGLGWERKEKFLKRCDVVLSSVPGLPIKYKLFGYGVDPEVFYPRGEKVFDFGFSGALHNEENYPNDTFPIPNLRKKVQELARTQTDLSLFLNGSDEIKPRIMNYEKYAEILSQSKIWLSTTGPDGDIGP